MELNTKVQPKFVDGECSIVFSLSFNEADKQIGEAEILTCEEEMDAQLIEEEPILMQKVRNRKYPKIAFITDLVVTEGHKKAVLQEINKFLKVIGIHNIRYQNTRKASLA